MNTNSKRASVPLSSNQVARVDRAAKAATERTYGSITATDILKECVSAGLNAVEAELGLVAYPGESQTAGGDR